MSGSMRPSLSSRQSVSSRQSGASENAYALAEVDPVDVFPPSKPAVRRRALLRSAMSVAVHDDSLTHAQRRGLLHVAQDSDKERHFDDVFNRFLDIIANSEEVAEEGEEEGEDGEAGAASTRDGGVGMDVVSVRERWRRMNTYQTMAVPLFGLFIAALAAFFRRRAMKRLGSGNVWVLLLAARKLAMSAGEDAWEWLWEGLCEGARSRFFENVFCVLVGHVLVRLPAGVAGLLEWIIE